MQAENLQAEALRRTVFSVYRIRVLAHLATATEELIETISRISLRSIQRCLEKEGIEFAAFLCGKSSDAIPTIRWIEESILEEKVTKADFEKVCNAVEVVLHAALNTPSQEERIALLSNCFCLHNSFLPEDRTKIDSVFRANWPGIFGFMLVLMCWFRPLGERFSASRSKSFSPIR